MQLRKENGIAALTTSDELMQAAQVRADEMAASGAYSHTRPDGRKYVTVTDCQYVGEIFTAWRSGPEEKSLPETVMWAWAASAGHLKNMTNSRYGALAWDLPKARMKMERTVGTVSSSLWMQDVPSVGWITPQSGNNNSILFCKMRTVFTARISISPNEEEFPLKKLKTRFLSAILALLTLLTLLPTSALAASGSGTGIKPTTNPNLWSTRLTSTGQPYSYRPPTAAGKQLYCMDLATLIAMGQLLFSTATPTKAPPVRTVMPCGMPLSQVRGWVRWMPLPKRM